MPNVIFAVPFALETTLRFARAAARLPGVRIGVISQEAASRLPEDLKKKLSAHEKVDDALDSAQLARAVRNIARQWGGKVDKIIGVLEQLQVPLAEVREGLGIPGMSVEAAHNFRDKARMKDVLRANDLPCARHQLATNAGEALEFADSSGYPLVVKPPAGAGAKNTFRVETRQELEGALRSMPPSSKEPMLLEEFIVGREHSFDSITMEGEHVFHSLSHYYPSPLEVMETPWIQWCVVLPRSIDGPEYEDILSAGRRSLDSLGMVTGMTHMEWFRRENGSLAISEVAARPPGAQFTTLISYAHDLDFYMAWARLMAFDAFEPAERLYSVGAAFLRGQGSGEVKQVSGLEEIQREHGNMIVEAKLPAAGQSQASSYEGEGFVIVRHPETDAVESCLKKIVSTIRIELG